MKFIEENVRKYNIISTKGNNFRNMVSNKIYYYHYTCDICGYPYLGSKEAKYCSLQCMGKDEIWIEENRKRSKGKNNGFYGKTHTYKTIENLRNLALNMPIERRERISQSLTGRCCPNHSIRMTGDNNPNWKGGISCEPYCTQWTDREYKNHLKYKRDRGECQNPQCNGKYSRLCLHHINYNKKDCRPINLITACESCNSIANKNREWHEAYYNEIMRRKYNVAPGSKIN